MVSLINTYYYFLVIIVLPKFGYLYGKFYIYTYILKMFYLTIITHIYIISIRIICKTYFEILLTCTLITLHNISSFYFSTFIHNTSSKIFT